MKKTLIALTAIVTLAGLANADVIRSETATLSVGSWRRCATMSSMIWRR